MKKILAFLLCLALAVSCMSVCFASDAAAPASIDKEALIEAALAQGHSNETCGEAEYLGTAPATKDYGGGNILAYLSNDSQAVVRGNTLTLNYLAEVNTAYTNVYYNAIVFTTEGDMVAEAWWRASDLGTGLHRLYTQFNTSKWAIDEYIVLSYISYVDSSDNQEYFYEDSVEECSVFVKGSAVPLRSVAIASVDTGYSIGSWVVPINVGDTYKAFVKYDPELTTTYKFCFAQSSNSSVATVANVAGILVITGKAPGTATITATCGSVKNTISVKVAYPVTGISLNKTTLTTCAGNTSKLTATLAPAGTSGTITWTSSDKSVATVENGTVTAVKAGTAKITASCAAGYSAVCTVTVVDHAYSTTGHADPTCTERGYTAYKCGNCGGTYTEYTDALGHEYDGDTVRVEPTASRPGSITGHCSRCGEDAAVTVLPAIFTDVTPERYYSDAVDYAYENSIIAGFPDSTFRPDNAMTRGQLVTILYRIEGEPEVTYEATFSDVPAGKFYSEAVIWANSADIVRGYNNGTFQPGTEVTREQIATILYRYASYKGDDVTASADLSSYADSASISNYALKAMQWANAEQLINGTPTGLKPKDSATRAQVATILYRYLTADVATPEA